MKHLQPKEAWDYLHGSEGELDAQLLRSPLSGWRFDALPWAADAAHFLSQNRLQPLSHLRKQLFIS